MDNINTLKNFVVDNFLFGQADSLEGDTDFFEKGIIDSTGILELVSFVEETFDLEVEDDELVPENFSSLNNVNEFINKKLIPQEKVS